MNVIAYTLADAAAACGVSERVLRRAIDRGDLSVRYPTARPVILVDELRDWMESRPTHRESRGVA